VDYRLCQSDRVIINDELEIIQKEVVVACFLGRILSHLVLLDLNSVICGEQYELSAP
jgi:hypothetical protein